MLNISPRPDVRLRLFCVPFAGRGATVFHGWDRYFPPGIQVCPVHLPGRESRLREPLFDRLEPVVDALVREMQPHLDVPFALFGHSLGALIAYGTACRLRDAGHLPVRLIVSAQVAPHCLNGSRQLHRLPDAEFIEALRRYYGGIPDQVAQDRDLMAMFVPILRADLAIIETYQHRDTPPLDCPISGFRGTLDDQISAEGFARWQELTTGGFTPRDVVASHFFLSERRDIVLQAILEDLNQPARSGV